MAGLYIHIPFCKQACHYCNFHFSTSLKYRTEMVNAICKELELQQPYLNGATLSSIYIGGGTPSLLEVEEIEQLFNQIHRLYAVQEAAEITLEANPDDLTANKLTAFRQTPINRLSIGIQSFHDVDLKYMNRAHNAEEATNVVQLAQDKGFTNLTIDLIYGAPTTTDEMWQANLAKAIALDVPHISSYALTVEPKTALEHFVQVGKSDPIDEQQSARQFEELVTCLEASGFVHYEISNFAKPEHFAQHNANYWKGKTYLGVGPSAHSFNGHSRQWNIAHNAKYLKAITANQLPFEMEQLTPAEQYNEYVMTGLRTIWGCDLDQIATIHSSFVEHFQTAIQKFIQQGLVASNDKTFTLTKAGKFLADGIAVDLFILSA